MNKVIKSGVIVLVLIFLTIAGIWQLTPPAAVPADAAETEFSSERAMEHIKTISQVAHPIGTDENYKVRDYIVEELTSIGLKPEVQTATVANEDIFEGVKYNIILLVKHKI